MRTTRAVPSGWLQGHARAENVELDWVRAPAAHVAYRPTRTSGATKLVVVSHGEVQLAQSRRQVVVRAGQFTWLDADQPFDLEALGRSDHLVIRIPRELLEQRHPELDLREAIVRGDGAAGERILAGLLTGLALSGAELASSDVSAAIDTLVTAVGLGPRNLADDARRARIGRALRYIHAHLADRNLAPERVAEAQGVSRRYLDDLFKQQRDDSIAGYIRRTRLERCARDLLAHPQDPAVSVGQRWGFVDASHFTRLFKRHFGTPPAAFRRRGLEPTSDHRADP